VIVATALLIGATAAQALAAQEPIRLGFLGTKTGPIAAPGKEMENGMVLFLEEHNYTLAGRKVEMTSVDTATQPALALTKTRELVERNKVHILIGPLAAFEAYAIIQYVNDNKVPLISPSAAADDLTQRKASTYFFRAASTSSQPLHPFGTYAAKTLGYKRIATLSDDFAFGHELVAGFHRTFEDAGGQIVQKLWPPLGTADFGPYMGQLKKDVDAVFAGFTGIAAVRFTKAFQEYGLKGKVPFLGGQVTMDEALLRNMGDEALGVISAAHYTAALAIPANQKFVQAYRQKFGQDPGYYPEGSYTAGMMLKQALEKVGGRIEDREAFLAALRAVTLPETPAGPVRLDKYGQPVHNIYIRKTERKDGRLQNIVTYTFENVSQFYTYNEADYLKAPPYGRDNPPCKHC
jgi:branched-chain amino acid transport system substrate-binding protein